LLVASGETCGPIAGSPTPGVVVASSRGYDGGGPYGVDVDGTSPFAACSAVAGPAVRAKGSTFDTGGGGAYWIDGEALCGPRRELPGADPGAAGDIPVEAAGERGSPAGAPHAVQNLRVPMSSAPHFAQ
jgi:hypothetical protein